MCAITGYFNIDDAEKLVLNSLKIMKNRGKDGCGIIKDNKIEINKDIKKLIPKNSKNAMGHLLHSMVSYLPQPLEYKNSFLVSNCEIYNWKELSIKYDIDAKNDSELLIRLFNKLDILEDPTKILNKLDGVYAFAFLKDNRIILARDIIGVKPLFYSEDSGFCFASEKKALLKNKIKNIIELNPRSILDYNIKTKKTRIIKKDFFNISPIIKGQKEDLKKEVKKLILNAVKKRIPENKKIGLLFSGGVDSTFLALILKSLNIKFTCYTAALIGKGLQIPEDLKYSREIAKKYNLDLKEITIDIKNLENKIKKTIDLIEDTNVVKVGVGLTFLSVCEKAKKDGIRLLLSGLGSEEIFAGYERHKNSLNINEECLSGLRKMYERDLYRDDVITMNNSIELRLPYLDKELVKYSLKIPERFKLTDDQNKIVLREIAHEFGLEKKYSYRKKKAAQYGSRFDAAITKLAKKNKMTKSQYLDLFKKDKILKLGALFSGGKDSNYALYLMQKHNYEISCLITLKSKNDESYMFHTPAIGLTKLQARSLNIPLIEQETEGNKESELKDLESSIKKAKDKYQIEGIVTGAIFSNYQRDRIEKICDRLNLKIFSPLWHKNQEDLMKELIKEKYEIILTAVACEGLNKNHLNKIIDETFLNELVSLNKRFRINVAGEGGEFESLVLNAPNFKKKIKILTSNIIEDKNSARLIVEDAKLY